MSSLWLPKFLSGVAALGLVACGQQGATPVASSSPASASGSSVSRKMPLPQIDLNPEQKVLWASAQGGDALAAQKLSAQLGWEASLGLAHAEPAQSHTLVMALSQLPDAEDAAAALGDLVRDASAGAVRLRYLRGLWHIANRAPNHGEPTAPDGVKSAQETLIWLATSRDQPEAERNLARSVLRRWVARGQLDAKRIP